MKFKLAFIPLFIALFLPKDSVAQHAETYRLRFHAGDLWRVQVSETLRLMMHFPQVDRMDQKPSIRTTDYSFTETIEQVQPDGSAIVAATLDSFKTQIMFGEGKHAENFFQFNSATEWDL